MFVTLCYMAHNDTSPIYRSDLVMVTRADDAADAPFAPFDEGSATIEQLFAELNSKDWSRRYRAHVELTRRGAVAAKMAAERLGLVAPGNPATTHLIWLAAADADAGMKAKIVELTQHADAEIRLTAMRALARFGAEANIFLAALNDTSSPIRHAALIGLFDQTQILPFEEVVKAAGDDATFIRQAAAFMLARRASVLQINGLCESSDSKRRRAGVLAAGFRLTVPEWDKAPDPSTPLAGGNTGAYRVTYAGGLTENLSKRGRAGNFTIADVWAGHTPTADEASLSSLLVRRMEDSDENISRQAAIFVRLLGDVKTVARADELLGVPAIASGDSKAPIADAKATGVMVMPDAFRALDWNKEVAKGDVAAGQKIFAARGCANCHAIKAGDAGGGAPSLAGVGTRFSITYLVESVMLPNKVVAPEFRWTVAKLKDADVITGLVTSETAGEVEFLLPTGVHKTVKKAEIVARKIEDRSPMPDALIQTPQELRDLVAYLASVKQ
jgi:putative heme-binding domain-containing protein